MDSNGWTALHHAAYNGDKDSAEILIDNRANVNAYSNQQKTPLHFAAFNNHVEII
jgi:ankyrin repeat protein